MKKYIYFQIRKLIENNLISLLSNFITDCCELFSTYFLIFFLENIELLKLFPNLKNKLSKLKLTNFD